MVIKIDSVKLLKSLMFISMQKIDFMPPFFLEM